MSKSHGHHHAQRRVPQPKVISNDNQPGAEAKPEATAALTPFIPAGLVATACDQMERMMALPMHMLDMLFLPFSFWLDMFSPADDGPRVVEDENAQVYAYRIPLKGIVGEQLSLRFQNDTLLLHVRETDTTERVRFAQPAHSFRRAISLPEFCDASRIEAVLEDEVLTITIPKSEEPVAPKQNFIPIASHQ